MKNTYNPGHGNSNIGSQYQNFAHLLYGSKAKVAIDGSGPAVSSYKNQNQVSSSMSNSSNTRTVPVTSFPNGRVTTMLQNSYSNSVTQNTSSTNYSRSHLNTNTIKNYRVQQPGRSNQKQNELSSNSFSRSKSVFKDKEWPRGNSSGSRSTAAQSSALPPAFKKNSSISADYGKGQVSNLQYQNGTSSNGKMINPGKIRMTSNSSHRMQSSISGSSRSNERSWTLKGSNISSDYK